VTRETRNNLIFLSIITALLLPGMVILFIKKLDPQARKMYLPDPVSDRIGYMDPEELPPGKRRMIPPKAAAWARNVVTESMGADAVALAVALRGGASAMPVMSERLLFELVGLRVTSTQVEVGVLLWNRRVVPPFEMTMTTLPLASEPNDAIQAPVDWRLEASKDYEFDQHLRNELGAYGFRLQPRYATLLTFKRPIVGFEAEQPTDLRLTVDEGQGRRDVDTLRLPALNATRSLAPATKSSSR